MYILCIGSIGSFVYPVLIGWVFEFDNGQTFKIFKSAWDLRVATMFTTIHGNEKTLGCWSYRDYIFPNMGIRISPWKQDSHLTNNQFHEKRLVLFFLWLNFSRWWFQISFIFTLFGEDSHVDSYFSNALTPPTTFTPWPGHRTWYLLQIVRHPCLAAEWRWAAEDVGGE